MDNKKIGLFIASLRKDKNMTQKELADKLYISDQAVSKWERGLSMPDISLIEKLSEYLEVSVGEILKGEKIDEMTKKKSDEIVKTSISFFQREYFKNKIILITSIFISSIVILGTILYILGTVDYIRAMNGKKPIFIYHTVSALDSATNIEGTEYYGIGYKISLCDNKKNNYIFQTGHKQKDVCYTNLTCTEDERGTLVLIDESTVAYAKNDKRSYDFTFFEDKLYLINSKFLIPTSSIEDEKTWTTEMLKYFDVPGVNTSIKKINKTTYEMKQSCNITEILIAGSKNVCSIDYFGEEIFGLRKTDILDQYHEGACK
jgi:transcriptional regulator with XRE-family HTH domain